MRVDIGAQRDSKEKTGKFRHAGLISYLKFFGNISKKMLYSTILVQDIPCL